LKVRALVMALQGRLQGRLPAGCRHAADMRLCPERLGGSPRLCFALKVRALVMALLGRLQGRLQGRLPAGCRHAADKQLGGRPFFC
ncbi:MAG: hypothetical protein ACKO2L_10230, partial [Planctomycetaceae bacterium]